MHATTPRNEIGFTDLIGRHGAQSRRRINALHMDKLAAMAWPVPMVS